MQRRLSLVLLNTLSLSRVVLAAVFLSTADVLLRVGLVVAAALTDFLDGWIARRKQLATRLGALIDPIADRVFVVSAFTTYLLEGLLTVEQYGVLLVRDAATVLGFVVARLVPALRHVEFKARLPGKIVTTLQLVVLLAVLMVPVAVPWLVVAVGAVALWAVVDYTAAVWRRRKRQDRERTTSPPGPSAGGGEGVGE
jgi:phosphatidylglycerophosphate synthase